MADYHYPKFLYHADFEPFLVQSKDAHKKLGKGWVESPAELGIETAPSRVVPVEDPNVPKKRVVQE
jgi:hypothetical protein